jgi:hypothetical protein
MRTCAYIFECGGRGRGVRSTASTTHSLDLLLGELGEVLGLNNDGLLGQSALAQHLEETLLGDVDDGHGVGGSGLGVLLASLVAHEGPQDVQVDDGAVEFVHLLVEVPHTDLTEVTRVVLVEVNAVMVLTTGVTTTT